MFIKYQLNTLDYLNKIKENDNILRFGTLFSTKLKNYYYDTGTGKIIELDDDSFYILNSIINNPDYLPINLKTDNVIEKDKITLFLDFIKDENLFKSPKIDKLYSPSHYENLGYLVENRMEQLIIKLTDQCNFRCRYCIYSEGYEQDVNFSNTDIDEEMAFRTVDYFLERCADDAAVTFYGGEPLLKYDLMKKIIDYTIESSSHENITFSFTTNASLINDEMAKYFGTVQGLSILCSLDGPEYVHDSYRVYENGIGTFSDTIKGIEKLFKYRVNNSISINAVLAPPYDFKKINDIETFFKKSNVFAGDTNITIGYPTEGSVINEEYFKKIEDNPLYSYKDGIDPFGIWKQQQVDLNGIERGHNSILSQDVSMRLTKINNRFVNNKPTPIQNFNGCCVPAARRLYVETDGKFYLCERIGLSPDIGNVNDGVDLNKVRKIYLEDYSKKFSDECKNCWAIRLCDFCYIDRVDKDGIKQNYNFNECDYARKYLKSELTFYHRILEESPNSLAFLEDVIIK